jgi:hypothetical protein
METCEVFVPIKFSYPGARFPSLANNLPLVDWFLKKSYVTELSVVIRISDGLEEILTVAGPATDPKSSVIPVRH